MRCSALRIPASTRVAAAMSMVKVTIADKIRCALIACKSAARVTGMEDGATNWETWQDEMA